MASSGRELLQAGTSGVNVSMMDTMSQRAGPGDRDGPRTPGSSLGDKSGGSGMGASEVGGSPMGGGGNSSAVAPRNYAPAGSRRQRMPQGSRKAGGQYA
eukprot:CAMPEP_0119471570 /NCGR_PEP_ID=MMETSP1344-20130328/3980_1 /TAXON_ID=236787 /ORGANISM="Florenciella parvula, Strain CCMP2471" /LENGTH=98 /DNA_ID=CAMNT_0007504367 /DNA_START=287 /DNA_END=583 /DNA_ORIENTATION=-